MTNSFLQDFEAEAAKVIAAGEADIAALAKEIGPIVLNYGSQLIGALANIAFGAVMAQVPNVISGEEKFGSAVASTIMQMEAKGWQVIVQDVQLAVQAIYDQVKAKAQESL